MPSPIHIRSRIIIAIEMKLAQNMYDKYWICFSYIVFLCILFYSPYISEMYGNLWRYSNEVLENQNELEI